MAHKPGLQNAVLPAIQVDTPSQPYTRQSLLLQLPFELRSQILRFVVTQPESIDLWAPGAPFSIDVRVMYVCRQLRDEARPLLYDDNTLDICIESRGKITSLHFSRHHLLCEYDAQATVDDIVSVFLGRFSHFRFRFHENARILFSLYRAISAIQACFTDNHITVILPTRKEENSLTRHRAAVLARRTNYPRVDGLLCCFSIIRCRSFSVISPDADHDLGQYEQLTELVTSNRPVVDMTLEFEQAQRAARSVDRMLLPDGLFPEFERLSDQVFQHLAAMGESARTSSQATFLSERDEFYHCYREVANLQWRLE